jgi:RNA polymerase sigma-70 factor (ECF subfamily)
MTEHRESTPADDAALVHAARGGDQTAFEALIQRHLGLVFSIAAARLSDREAAEDLTQEVFLRAHLALNQLSHSNRFAPWVAQITRNQAASWLRREQRRSALAAMIPLDQSTHEIPDPEPSGGPRAMETEETDRAVWQAIQRLPGDQRELVMLHFVEGLSTVEIADRLDLHRTTVRRHMKRALASMREMIEPVMRESGPRLRASHRLASRTVALIAAAWALAPSAHAALAASASATAAPSVVKLGLLAKIKAAIAAGGKTMLTAKGIAALLGATAIGGGALLVSQAKDESTPAPAPTFTAQQAVGATATQTPAFATARYGTPGPGMMVAATYATPDSVEDSPMVVVDPEQQPDWTGYTDLPAVAEPE